MTTPVMVTVAWALSWHLPENVPTHPGSMGLSSAPATTVGLCLSGCIRGPRCPPPSALCPPSSEPSGPGGSGKRRLLPECWSL
jgi:hypothetical protein